MNKPSIALSVVVQARHKKKPVKKTAKGRASREPSVWERHARDLWILLLIVIGAFALLAEGGALGPVGRAISKGLAIALGIGRFALPVMLVGLGIALVVGRIDVDRNRVTWGIALGLISICGIGDLAGGRPTIHATTKMFAHAGGWLGSAVGGGLVKVIGIAGTTVVLLALLLVALMVSTGIGLRALYQGTATSVRYIGSHFAHWWSARERPERDVVDEDDEEEVAPTRRQRREARLALEPDPEVEEYEEEDVEEEEEYEEEYEEEEEEEEESASRAPYVAAMESDWELPPSSLLIRTKELKQDRGAIEELGGELVEALAAHGVETTLVGFTIGPTVTRYELELGPGVRVASVTSLNKDIAYAMASPEVRILAPIPGRSAIGVEVPNRQRSLVALGDLLASAEAEGAMHPLDVPIGRDISGKTTVVNLGEMPHVLISGATGAGKSSLINSIVTSLVMRATPDTLRLMLVDPKRVEMGQYNDLPHLLAPVVVDPKKAAGMLAWAVKEMERRYGLLAESGARDITSYQQMAARGELEPGETDEEVIAEIFERTTGLASDVDAAPGPEHLPYIVIVVDELNDLMMVAARDVEESVVRIAQMARAVGIHLVLATQRPSVDVITGVIKANIPSRIAFAVSSLADSRVILDQAGAERLIGKGDMLLLTASSNVARRLQAPWVSEDEVHKVVEAWRRQGGRRENVIALDVPSSRGGSSGGSNDDDDAVLAQARELVIRTQSGSTSMLQRKLRVGFARAGRLMDELEQEGVVAPGDGSKARKVLVTLEEYDEQTSL
jgi:S-DNA-T family DNA segregation ATPase FtsK/SpoIIIE